jgi:hypothetical protein
VEKPAAFSTLLFRVAAKRSEHQLAMPKRSLSRSTVQRHFGVVGRQMVFWLPNRPISFTASFSGRLYCHSTGTKYSQRSGSSMNSRW